MYEKCVKRILDILIALIAMPFVILFVLAVAPFIILEDGLPVFYNSYRIGRYGKIFKMYKFRTMKNNSPDIRIEDGSTYNAEDDPRVTRIGRILRKTSIDEIPQLLNVLKGEMSLIGPRPDPPDWLGKYTENIRIFLKVRPGITGYSQAYFRNSVDGYEKMKNDAYYAMHCDVKMDLKIFFKTIKTVIGHENTYKDLKQKENKISEKSQNELEFLKK